MRTLYFGTVPVVGILLLTLNAGCEERLQVPSARKSGNFLGEIDTSFKPRMDQVSLQIRGLTERPTGPMREWSQSFDVGDNIIGINKSNVSAIAASDRQEKWTITSKNGMDLRWLNHHLSMGLLQEYEAENEQQERHVREPARLLRIDLKTGKWLDDLELDVGVGRKIETVLSALGDQQDLAVLVTSVSDRVAAAEIPSTRAYDVLCFRGNDLKPRWIKSFAAGQSRAYGGVFVWGIPRPAYPFSNLQHLSWTEESLIVAVEALQPIRSLERESGVMDWELDRIWEFERGFIGPSVYRHYLGRFGIDDHRSGFVPGSDRYLEEHAKIEGLAEARKKFEEQYSCAIIGGPIVARLNPERGGPVGRAYRRGPGSYSMFVAISKAPKREWSNYISDCVIYELGESGDVLSMVKSPQMVCGENAAVSNGDIVWAGQNDTLMKLALSKTTPHIMGGSGNDLITKSPWLHQSDYQPADPWLDAWRLTTRVAFGKSFAAYVPAGGYVSVRTDHKFEFPISIVDLSSGLKHEAILELPFEGEVSKPQSRIPGRNDPESSVNPYFLGISDIRASNESLEVTLGLAEWSATLAFDMSHLLNAAGPPQSPKRIRHGGTRSRPRVTSRC